MYEYVYLITAHVDLYPLMPTENFSKEEFEKQVYEIESDILQEHFYYGIINVFNSIKPTFDVKFKISIKKNKYTIKIKILSNSDNMINKLKKFYKLEDFNISEILDGYDYNCNDLNLGQFEINEIVVTIKLFKINDNIKFIDENDKSTVDIKTQCSFIKKKTYHT